LGLILIGLLDYFETISGGQFSPIPKGLLDKMVNLNLNKSGTSNSPQSGYQASRSTHSTKQYQYQASTVPMVIHPG